MYIVYVNSIDACCLHWWCYYFYVGPSKFVTGNNNYFFNFVAPSVSVSYDSSKFEGQELSKSERPELTAAKTVISGGEGHFYHDINILTSQCVPRQRNEERRELPVTIHSS